MRMPQVLQSFFALEGGLDLLTPQIALAPGNVFDAQNYEPEIAGGYSRIDGYERFDGQSKPSDAQYWVMTVASSALLAVGNTITGLSSGITGKVLNIVGNTLVLGRVTGAFILNESMQVAAVTKTTATGLVQQSGEPDPSNDADYTLLAANDIRLDIQAVPGSGKILGISVYKEEVYAFRNNVAGTASNMYRSSAGGWVLITLPSEIFFNTGLVPPVVGQIIKGATSGATATVAAVLLRTGGWGSSGIGTLVLTNVVGVFAVSELLKNAALAVTYATASTTAAQIVRAPNGRIETVIANFTGSTATQRMYGCDGVNPAFEYDGATYVPIRTGMAVDTPEHIMFHRFFLFLSFRGSVQFSAVGNPYAWTVVLGAGEIGLADEITGFVPQGGNNAGSTLAIFTKNRVYMLYGSSALSFNLVLSIFDIGYLGYTMQAVSNNTFGLTNRGIQSLITTLTYGDFDYKSVSHMIQPLILQKRGLESCSTSLRAKDQYRLFFTDGTAIALTLTGDDVSALMPLNYGRPVRCALTTTFTSGKERTFFGSDDGFIYEDNLGTSFDGAAIEAWIRTPFNHFKSPRMRKRFRRAVFEIKPYGFSKVDIGYDIGYGNPYVQAPVSNTNNAVFGGGYWDQFIWDQFTWDAKTFSDVSVTLTGTEKNISFLFYSNRAQDRKHTVQGMTVLYTPQRVER